MGISFRSRVHLKPDVFWGVLGNVVQYNARFGLSDRLEVHLVHVMMPAGNESDKTKGRSLYVLCAIKSIVVFKTAFLCLAHALITAMAKVNGDPKFKSYRDCKGFKQPVQNLLSASGFKLNNGGAFKRLRQFKNYLSHYKIIVYDVLSPDRVIFSGNSLSNKKLYVLYDSGHFNVITKLKKLSCPRSTYVTRGHIVRQFTQV